MAKGPRQTWVEYLAAQGPVLGVYRVCSWGLCLSPCQTIHPSYSLAGVPTPYTEARVVAGMGVCEKPK